MKNKDLIAKLQELDPESEVVIHSDNFELRGAIVPLRSINVYDTSKKIIEGFSDAFDGGYYTKEVYDLFNGEEKIILIS